jgi:hypothetical protein
MSHKLDNFEDEEFEFSYGFDPDTCEYTLNPNKPVTLLLDYITNSNMMDHIKVANHQYKSKILKNSNPENWKKTLNLFNEFRISCVLCKVSARLLWKMNDIRYGDYVRNLFQEISKYPNQFFIHKNYFTNFSEAIYYEKYAIDVEIDRDDLNILEKQFKESLDIMKAHGLEIIPYSTNAEMSVLATSFLEGIEKNLLFKLYIPNERIWSEPQGKIIKLFKEYLNNIFHSNIRLTEKHGRYGNSYELYGEIPSNINLNEKFNEFTKFLNSFNEGVKHAQDILEKSNISSIEVQKMLNLYQKESRRLLLDIKQESEQKILSLRHRLEVDIENLDVNLTNEDYLTIRDFSDSISFANTNFNVFPSLKNISSLPTTINATFVKPNILNIANSAVSEIIFGDRNTDNNFNCIKNLICEYGGKEQDKLITSLLEARDEDLPITERKSAAAKIKSFLLTKVPESVSSVALGLLQSYIEKILGL